MSALQIRIDDNLRASAEKVFRSMGMSLSDGVRTYLNFVSVTKELPFAPISNPLYAHNQSGHIPNKDTAKTINDADNGVGIESFDNTDELFKSLGV